uniref:Isopenicillin N synthase-like Fe(2+) 2OG dioxygenase domain-containing protein n=1 Tax=Oryza nivara TaxID=4536 RepID=A0A0E0I6X7_ORYNI
MEDLRERDKNIEKKTISKDEALTARLTAEAEHPRVVVGEISDPHVPKALGLKQGYLPNIGCNQGQMILCHYYPPCPQPELAIGTTRHSDSSFLTVLLQDQTGGLQVLHNNRPG